MVAPSSYRLKVSFILSQDQSPTYQIPQVIILIYSPFAQYGGNQRRHHLQLSPLYARVIPQRRPPRRSPLPLGPRPPQGYRPHRRRLPPRSSLVSTLSSSLHDAGAFHGDGSTPCWRLWRGCGRVVPLTQIELHKPEQLNRTCLRGGKD